MGVEKINMSLALVRDSLGKDRATPSVSHRSLSHTLSRSLSLLTLLGMTLSLSPFRLVSFRSCVTHVCMHKDSVTPSATQSRTKTPAPLHENFLTNSRPRDLTIVALFRLTRALRVCLVAGLDGSTPCS